jgi:MtN3 and saliva related transmembrane protein
MLIGLVGAVLILIAWLPETYRTIKSKNVEAIDIRFLVIYVTGSSLLAFYSIQINDVPFTILNSVIALITLIELDIVLRKKSKK